MGMIGLEVGRSLKIGVSKSFADNNKEAQAVELYTSKIAAWIFVRFDDNVSINLCFSVAFVSQYHNCKLLYHLAIAMALRTQSSSKGTQSPISLYSPGYNVNKTGCVLPMVRYRQPWCDPRWNLEGPCFLSILGPSYPSRQLQAAAPSFRHVTIEELSKSDIEEHGQHRRSSSCPLHAYRREPTGLPTLKYPYCYIPR